jgi:light-regulated signal transduction histidine kinase (bacteriophytochrome)
MRRLITDLLGYSRVTTKANPFKQVNLNKVLADVLGDLQIRIDESKATINASMRVRKASHLLQGRSAHFVQELIQPRKRKTDP